MMSIGEFARRSRLPRKPLRIYDEPGLLPPAHVDEDSGYRYCGSVAYIEKIWPRRRKRLLCVGPVGRDDAGTRSEDASERVVARI